MALFERVAKSKLPTAPLLSRDDGKPMDSCRVDGVGARCRQAAKVEGVPEDEAKLPDGVCLYTLRHSFISQAINDGLTPLDIARHAGTSLSMVDRHYGKLVKSASVERLAKVQMI